MTREELRERRNCFGELIQIDGSPHDCFEGRGEKCCLLVFIRVERANKTLQDRLAKELRLAGVSDIETANKFLPNFIEEYNKKLVVEPKSKANAHRQLNLSDEELNLIFSIQTIRTVSRNLELSYNDTVYQIQVLVRDTLYVMRKY